VYAVFQRRDKKNHFLLAGIILLVKKLRSGQHFAIEVVGGAHQAEEDAKSRSG
jgi:hypothetical protein